MHTGFEAMLKGEGNVVTGWLDRLPIRHRQHHALKHAGGTAPQASPAGRGSD